MTAYFKARKNSNVDEYVKARVLNSNLDFFLSNGIEELLNRLSSEIDTDDIVIWQNGLVEFSIYSDFYKKSPKEIFSDSFSKRFDLKGININSAFFSMNKEIFDEIKSKVIELVEPMSKKVGLQIFGFISEDETKVSNVLKYYYMSGESYVLVREPLIISKEYLPYLKIITKEEFDCLYRIEKER